MIRPLYIWLLFLLFSHSLSLSAQPYFDLASVQGMFNKPDRLINNKTGDVDVHWESAQLTYPHLFKDTSVLVVSAGYEAWQLGYATGDVNLHSAYLPVTFLKPLSPTWKVSVTAIPRFNAQNDQAITDKTYQLGGAIIATHKISSAFSLKFGGYYNREFFGDYWLPLIGGDWKVNDRLYLFGLLPNNLFIDYKINKHLHTGFIYKGVTASFRLKEENAFDYYRMQEGQLKLFADVYLTKNLVFNIEAGHTVAREYGPGYLNEDYRILKLKEGALLKAGIYYRLWLN